MLEAKDLQWMVGYTIETSRRSTREEIWNGANGTVGGRGLVIAVKQTEDGPEIVADYGYAWLLTPDTIITIPSLVKEEDQ